MAQNPAERVPVIAGVGEVTDRPADPMDGREPIALMAEALRRAEADAGGGLLAALDSLDIVNEISWPYRDPVGRLCAALGVRPARAVYGVVGGQTPVRYLHDAALRIARAESAVAAVCGAEAEHTVQRARRAGLRLPWAGHDPDHRPIRGADFQRPVARRLGVATPPTVYPFYENATLAAWGQTPAQARAESAALWSVLSAVAAAQPNAWLGRYHAPVEIATPSSRNRPVAWPYLKLMVANPAVNQGAAVLLTSLARARAAGIPDHRLVHVWGGAAADEPRDYLARDDYRHSGAMEAVLEAAAALRLTGDGGSGLARFDLVELYSCFPCVPKMARRTLGFGSEVVPTVAGGLTFFGGPLNNYMGHAAVAMARRLRKAPGGVGLLYGQGEYVTKHHALIVASRPREDGGEPAQDYSVQAVADARRGPVPELVADVTGRASVETFTVLFDRDATPTHGVVIARTDGSGARLMARVPAEDRESLGLLLDEERSPIGTSGSVRVGRDGVPEWRRA
jgi:acetyl-CoA C-acetyltransferase